MSHLPDQARFYELQGSLSATPPKEATEEERDEAARDGVEAHPAERGPRAEARLGTRGLEPVPGSRAEEGDRAEPKAPRKPGSRIRPRLPMWVRVTLVVVAVLLLALGIAGLFLPFLQGILTLMLALAVFSLVSRTMHRLLHWSLRPWPGLRRRVERHRRRSHTWIHERVERWETWRRERRRRRWERLHGHLQVGADVPPGEEPPRTGTRTDPAPDPDPR